MLQTFAINSILNGNYDYLHGGLGVVKYYCDDAEFVNRALEALEQTAEKGDRIYKWKSSLGQDKGIGYNICLSHGMSSIVSVLSLLESEGINRERRDRIIRHTCNYILSQEIDHVKYGAFFPSQSLENNPGDDNHYSRLAWCYGDLGVATSLWQAGKALHNREWQEKALEVLRFSTSRRDFRKCRCYRCRFMSRSSQCMYDVPLCVPTNRRKAVRGSSRLLVRCDVKYRQ